MRVKSGNLLKKLQLLFYHWNSSQKAIDASFHTTQLKENYFCCFKLLQQGNLAKIGSFEHLKAESKSKIKSMHTVHKTDLYIQQYSAGILSNLRHSKNLSKTWKVVIFQNEQGFLQKGLGLSIWKRKFENHMNFKLQKNYFNYKLIQT